MIDWNNVILLAIAAINVVGLYITFRTHALTQKVEIATNSMKDAQVDLAGKVGKLTGREEGLAAGRAEGEVRAAALAEGRMSAGPVDVKVVETVPAEIIKSVPLEIKEKEPDHG